MRYPTLRTLHLLLGAFALPMLLMYAFSSVQMARPKWFDMKPTVTERQARVSAGHSDGREMTREVIRTTDIRGEISSIEQTPTGFNSRIVVPGTVHDIRYERSSGWSWFERVLRA